MNSPLRPLLLALLAVTPAAATAQRAALPDSVLVRALTFRSIGPASMGGRVVDIAVVESPKSGRGAPLGTAFYMAVATGGIYKTTNAGLTWTPVFDSVRTGSIGAVAVAPSNSDIVWVGTGEANNMRSSSWGTGAYKSTDGGKTWSGAMLPKTQHIARIVIDPRDPNVVYVAAMGPLWASGGDRGLFKTTDGGKTWTNTKQISDKTGFTELVIDPSNPDVLYAASLERERREYGFLPAGTESAIYKTHDAGRTWTKLTGGLPTGELGRIGLSVCRSKPSTVYAVIHAKGAANGIYRSDDSGSTWRQVNGVNGTAWYYSQIRCDPTDPEHVISLSAASRESNDGGKTWNAFAQGGAVHSDHHVLWINPEAPEQMILGGDGGLNMTMDRGRTWSHWENFVAAQFYAIAVDDAQPFYNVYGGLQDNQQWGGPNRTRTTFGPSNADWFRMHGGDGFYAVPDPLDYNLVYAEMQGGGVVRYDQRTGQAKNIKPVPPEKVTHRYNWSAPILPSRHDAKVVYMAANYLFRSNDRGDSWTTISPDLTRGIDRNKLPMRGAVPDSSALGRNEGTAEFSNISTVDESPLKAGLLVVGTDDGLIQVTRDGGKNWVKTDHFPGVPDTTYVSRVVFSRGAEGTIYATLDGHRSNDFKPYVMKSVDFGKTWTSIASDLPDGGSVQVIREHPRQPNLLFVGTEFGVFASIDGGAHWTQLKSGIPGVPVHDIQIQARMNDLVVGTHGRGVYILDDLAPLEHLAQAKQAAVAYLFPIRDELEIQPNATRNSGMGTSGFTGQNPELGARIAYEVNAIPADTKATITILDASGTVIRQMAANNKQGLFRQYWDMRVGPPLTGTVTDTLPPGTVVAGGRGGRGGAGAGGAGGGGGGGQGGGRGAGGDALFPALPGTYKARLTLTSGAGTPAVLEQSFTLRKDPMVILAESELKQLYAFRLSVASFQKTLRAKQAQADTTQRKFAEIRRTADSSLGKLTPEAKAKLAALTKEMAEIIAQVGAPPGAGRGGFGGGAAGGGGGGGRGGRGGGRAGGGRGGAADSSGTAPTGGPPAGGAAGGAIDDQNALPTAPSALTVQARFNALTEMLNVSFAVSDEQRKTLQALPADLQKQADRVTKVVTDELPALIKALKDSGVEVKTGSN
jgi:photosystem II stability/assembly factor-like uncharacterized protein/uncharacterized membrane protein YgcG